MMPLTCKKTSFLILLLQLRISGTVFRNSFLNFLRKNLIAVPIFLKISIFSNRSTPSQEAEKTAQAPAH